MKRTLAITAAAALMLCLAACGDMTNRTGDPGAAPNATTATDTLRNDNGTAGTGMTSGASTTSTNGSRTAGDGLGSVAGAVNRSGSAGANRSYGVNAGRDDTTVSLYRDRTTVDYANAADVRRAALAGDQYARMLENGRVHDTDGYLLDGENAHWRMF